MSHRSSVLTGALLVCEEGLTGSLDVAELFVCSEWFWDLRGVKGYSDNQWVGRTGQWGLWGSWDSRYKNFVIAMSEDGRILSRVKLPGAEACSGLRGLSVDEIECALRMRGVFEDSSLDEAEVIGLCSNLVSGK